MAWLQTHQTSRWVFRGEPKCQTSLRPAIGRGGNWNADREFLLYEMFAHRSRLFRPNTLKMSFIEEVAWAQHHGLPTRLLDWTTNPLAATYFAVQSPRAGDVIVHSVDAPEVGFHSDFELDSADTTRIVTETKFIETAPLSPRIAAQRGLFSLHHDPMKNWKPKGRDKDNDCFTIESGARSYFLSRLNQLGLDASTVMTDLDGLCASLRWWYQSGLQTPSTIGRRVKTVSFRSKV